MLDQIGLIILILVSIVAVSYILYYVFWGPLAEQSNAQIDQYTQGLEEEEREILTRISNVPENINLFYYTLLNAFREAEPKPVVTFTSIKIFNELGEEEQKQDDNTYHLYQNVLYTMQVHINNDAGSLVVSYFKKDFSEQLSGPFSDLALKLFQSGPNFYEFTFRVAQQGPHIFKLRHFTENQLTAITSFDVNALEDPTVPTEGVLAVRSTPYEIGALTLQQGTLARETTFLQPTYSVVGAEGMFYKGVAGETLTMTVKRTKYASADATEPFLLVFYRTLNKALDIFIERQDTYFASMDLLERRTDDGGYLITLPTTLLEAGYLVLELSTDLGVIDSKQPAGIIFDNFRWLPLGKKHPTRYDCLFNYFDPEKEGDTEGSLFYDTENYAVHLWQSEDAGVYVRLEEGDEPVPRTEQFFPGKRLCIIGNAPLTFYRYLHGESVRDTVYEVQDIILKESQGFSKHTFFTINGRQTDFVLRDYGLVYAGDNQHTCFIVSSNSNDACEEGNLGAGALPSCLEQLYRTAHSFEKVSCIDWDNIIGGTPHG